MWNTWVEKAKQAAATIDQQLNESVGVEAPAPQPAAATTSANDNDGSNVWNDDDFKFDDDDEEEQEEQQDKPLLAAVSESSAAGTADETLTASQKEEAPTTRKEEIEAPVTPNIALDEAAPSNEASQNLPEKSAASFENAWTEDDNQNFENFDGVSPTEPLTGAASEQQLHQQQATPSSPKGKGLVGAFPVNIGGLASKVKIPSKVNEINFMSPFSSVMTSIKHDQEQEEDEQEEEQREDIPLTPMKKEEEPVKAPKVQKEDIDPSVSHDVEAEAWQEEGDIQFDEDEVEPQNDASIAPKNNAKTEEPGSTDPKSPAEHQQEEKKVAVEETLSEVPSPPGKEMADEAPLEISKPIEDKENDKQSDDATAEQSTQSDATQPVEAKPEEPSAQPPVETSPSPTGPSVSSAELEQVKKLLAQREEQLAAKAGQMFELQQMYEKEKQELTKKIADTKEEAKKRIMKARERCEVAEAKLQASTSALTEDAAQQAQLVAALREEGEKLARKQAEMEKTVRAARGEARQLKEQLEDEMAAKEDALEKIENLQAQLMSTQEQLSSARKGETQAGKLDAELQAAKEEIANKANTIMSLEQNVKELKAENKELSEEVEAARQGAALDNEREVKRMRKEHNSTIADLESKLQISEREAAVREDSLRREVEELRKRWQDAVRRADALSMDVQSSTAPLLRQLESMERQHRARASAAAELETKLRAELEETVIQNEKVTKEHAELKMKYGRLERNSKEQQKDLEEREKTIDELTTKIARLEEKLQKMEIEGEKKKEEWAEVERLANEGVAKVRSEMSQAVLESEERYRSQLETMKEELRIEKEKRNQLEQQVDQLLENAAVIIPTPSNEYAKEAKPKKLRDSEGQAEILSSALLGLGGDSQDEDNDSDDENAETPQLHHQTSTGSSSFAALEHLTQNLKAAKKELETLRKRLAESEKTRESLVEELGESREAKEKLPLFEAKVKELMADNKEKELEIRGLQDDIAEVKEMYRTQLSVLLEEKAAAFSEVAKSTMLNGSINSASTSERVEEKQEEEYMPELVEDALGIA